MTLVAGNHLGPYEILASIGRGGMGEVYRARDTKLDREVAIKVLNATEPDRLRRFTREARFASTLNHPNIVHIYEIGEHDGAPYIAMEYVDGRTLRDILAEGPLASNELVQYATQMAEGLNKAHQAGIVHRDLKPENVVVNKDGYVKILDFGLARTSPTVGVDSGIETAVQGGTTPGTILGTVGYMSPEQARGEAVDFRSDHFSFGALLYEMATGERAFARASAAQTFAAILTEEPQLDGGLGRVVHRCLRKEPHERWQTTNELLNALKALRSPAPSSPRPPELSIAVLPFEDQSPERDSEYFSDGLTEEVTTELSNIRALRVISSRSARRLKGQDIDPTAIGRELNVRYLLEGSVRKAGASLRITARLIDTCSDVSLWAGKYRGTLDDVFDIQERVSVEIGKALRVELTPEDASRVAARPIEDAQAYECYLRAKHEIYRFDREGLDRAVELLKKGLEIVGDNALLYSSLGMAYWQYANVGVSYNEGDLERAEQYSAMALRLAPDSAASLFLHGLLLIFPKGDVQESANVLKRALEVQPDHSQALLYRSVALSCAGREAGVEITRLREIDPLTPFNQVAPTWAHLNMGRFSKAAAAARQWQSSDPDNPLASLVLGDILARVDDREAARQVLGEVARRWSESGLGRIACFLEHALGGDADAALAAVTPALLDYARWDLETTWEMATGYAVIGKTDEALDWLERSVQRGLINYPFLSEYDPLLASLRKESRFQSLMESVRAQWERFVV